jgi:hypothetical protein
MKETMNGKPTPLTLHCYCSFICVYFTALISQNLNGQQSDRLQPCVFSIPTFTVLPFSVQHTTMHSWNRGSSVSIVTRWTVRRSNPSEGEIFHTRPERTWDTPSLLYNGYRVFFEGKAAGAWRWPPTPSSAEVKERVELYHYSPSGSLWPVVGSTLSLPLLLTLPLACIVAYHNVHCAQWPRYASALPPSRAQHGYRCPRPHPVQTLAILLPNISNFTPKH